MTKCKSGDKQEKFTKDAYICGKNMITITGKQIRKYLTFTDWTKTYNIRNQKALLEVLMYALQWMWYCCNKLMQRTMTQTTSPYLATCSAAFIMLLWGMESTWDVFLPSESRSYTVIVPLSLRVYKMCRLSSTSTCKHKLSYHLTLWFF